MKIFHLFKFLIWKKIGLLEAASFLHTGAASRPLNPMPIALLACCYSIFWLPFLNTRSFAILTHSFRCHDIQQRCNSEKQHTLSKTKVKRLRQFSCKDCHRAVVMKYCFEFVFCTAPAKLMECGNGARHLRKYGEAYPWLEEYLQLWMDGIEMA